MAGVADLADLDYDALLAAGAAHRRGRQSAGSSSDEEEEEEQAEAAAVQLAGSKRKRSAAAAAARAAVEDDHFKLGEWQWEGTQGISPFASFRKLISRACLVVNSPAQTLLVRLDSCLLRGSLYIAFSLSLCTSFDPLSWCRRDGSFPGAGRA